MTEFCNVSKLPVLSVAMLGGESPILCFNFIYPCPTFLEVSALSVPPSAAQCHWAGRSRKLAQEGLGAAVGTVGVNRAVLGGSHAMMLLHQTKGSPW